MLVCVCTRTPVRDCASLSRTYTLLSLSLSLSLSGLSPIRGHRVVQRSCVPTTTSRPPLILQDTLFSITPSLFLSFSLSPSFPPLPLPLSLSAGAGGAATSPERIRSLMSKSHSTQQCHTLPVVVEGGKDVGTLKKKKEKKGKKRFLSPSLSLSLSLSLSPGTAVSSRCKVVMPLCSRKIYK